LKESEQPNQTLIIKEKEAGKRTCGGQEHHSPGIPVLELGKGLPFLDIDERRRRGWSAYENIPYPKGRKKLTPEILRTGHKPPA